MNRHNTFFRLNFNRMFYGDLSGYSAKLWGILMAWCDRIILLSGLLISILTGINLVTVEKVKSSKYRAIRVNRAYGLSWSPEFGILLIVFGGIEYLWTWKRNGFMARRGR